MTWPNLPIKYAIDLAGVIIALAALAYTARSLSLSSRTARAQFWLALRDAFSRHDKVHRRLRPGGDWAGRTGVSGTTEEWAELEAYMGLFEHCEEMLKDRLIDTGAFTRIYKYRLENILANPIIVEEKLSLR